MTTIERHYELAEQWIKKAEQETDPVWVQAGYTRALVHATLATVVI